MDMRYLLVIVCVTVFALADAQDKSFLNIYDRHWEIDEGYYRVMKNGKIGLVNQGGDIIIPCENEQVWNLQDNGNVKVLKSGKLGIYNVSGDLVIPPVYEMIWGFEDGKARVLRNGKIGYVNDNGNEFIPCKYDQVWEFEDGKAKVLKNGKVGYVNLSGYEYIPCAYQKIWEFEDGKAKVLKNGKMGYINLQGVEIIPCEYQHIGEFEDGVARVVKNGQVSYIDLLGNPTVKVGEDGDERVTGFDYNSDADPAREVVKSKIKIVDGDTTRIKFFGSEIEVIEEDGSREFTFDGRSDRERDDRRRDRRRRRFKGHYWGVDLGLNNYVSPDGELSLPDEYDYLSLNTGKSFEASVNVLQQNIGLGSNVGFLTGLGLTYNNYRFDNPNIPVLDDNGNLSSVAITDPLEKNKLTTLYLTAPVLFELQFSRRRKEAFYISAGAIGGYRLKSYTKVVSKIDGERTKDKNKDSFALNDFRYGAHVRFGFKALNFYGTYYLSSMFENDKGPELYPVSFGVSIYPDFW